MRVLKWMFRLIVSSYPIFTILCYIDSDKRVMMTVRKVNYFMRKMMEDVAAWPIVDINLEGKDGWRCAGARVCA